MGRQERKRKKGKEKRMAMETVVGGGEEGIERKRVSVMEVEDSM